MHVGSPIKGKSGAPLRSLGKSPDFSEDSLSKPLFNSHFKVNPTFHRANPTFVCFLMASSARKQSGGEGKSSKGGEQFGEHPSPNSGPGMAGIRYRLFRCPAGSQVTDFCGTIPKKTPLLSHSCACFWCGGCHPSPFS